MIACSSGTTGPGCPPWELLLEVLLSWDPVLALDQVLQDPSLLVHLSQLDRNHHHPFEDVLKGHEERNDQLPNNQITRPKHRTRPRPWTTTDYNNVLLLLLTSVSSRGLPLSMVCCSRAVLPWTLAGW